METLDETQRLAEKVSKQIFGPDKNWFSNKPEDEDKMYGSYWRHTPCEVLRHIFQLTQAPKVDLEEIRLQLRIASTMAKCMARRLTIHEGRGWGRKIYPMTPWWESGKPGCVMPGRRG